MNNNRINITQNPYLPKELHIVIMILLKNTPFVDMNDAIIKNVTITLEYGETRCKWWDDNDDDISDAYSLAKKALFCSISNNVIPFLSTSHYNYEWMKHNFDWHRIHQLGDIVLFDKTVKKLVLKENYHRLNSLRKVIFVDIHQYPHPPCCSKKVKFGKIVKASSNSRTYSALYYARHGKKILFDVSKRKIPDCLLTEEPKKKGCLSEWVRVEIYILSIY